MALKERKHIEHIKTEELPGYEATLQQHLGGKAVPIQPDWSSFEDDLEACFSLTSFMNIVNNAIYAVTSDALGQETLRAQLQAIQIVNVPEPTAKKMTLSEGVLTLKTSLGHDDWEGRFQPNEIQEYLESQL